MKRIFKQTCIFFILIMLFVTILSINSFAESKKLVMFFSSGGSGKALAVAAEDFAEKTGIEMEVLTFPMDEVNSKQILALTQGVSTPDVISVYDAWLANLWKSLEPLKIDEETKLTLISSALESFRYPQKVGDYFALPVRTGATMLVYREDVFAEHGIDPKEIKTWEDLLKAAIKFNDPLKRQWGIVLESVPNDSIMSEWLSITGSYGVELLTPDYQKAAFNTENGIKATQLFIDLYQKAASPGNINYNNSDTIEAMKTGMATMAILYAPRFQAVNDPAFPYTGKFKVLPILPYGEGSGLSEGVPVITSWGLGVNKNSKNKEIAEEFVKFVASEEEQLRLANDYFNVPTVKSAYSDSKYLENIPIALEILKSIEGGQCHPVISSFTQVQDAICLQLGKAIVGDISASDALATAENNVNKILASK